LDAVKYSLRIATSRALTYVISGSVKIDWRKFQAIQNRFLSPMFGIVHQCSPVLRTDD